jgi:hypothetical protein
VPYEYPTPLDFAPVTPLSPTTSSTWSTRDRGWPPRWASTSRFVRLLSRGLDERPDAREIDIHGAITSEVGAATIDVRGVVVGLLADVLLEVGHTDGGHAVLHGDAVSPGKRAKVAVEGAVLLTSSRSLCSFCQSQLLDRRSSW